MTLQTMIVSLVTFGAGFAMLIVAGTVDWFKVHPGLQAVLNNLGSALIISLGLAVLWELFGRRAFTREIMETARLGTDIEAAGLLRIGANYLKDPDWEDLFERVQKLDVFFAYGRTWRNTNHSLLEKLAARQDARIRVFLPDPDDSETVRVLADRFGMETNVLSTIIREAHDDFSGLRKPGGAEIQVNYRKGDSLFSCYRFDRVAVVTLYSHRRERTQVPTLICREGGTLYEFVRSEFKALIEQVEEAQSLSSVASDPTS